MTKKGSILEANHSWFQSLWQLIDKISLFDLSKTTTKHSVCIRGLQIVSAFILVNRIVRIILVLWGRIVNQACQCGVLAPA